jgi:hypothetical protein
MLAWGDRWLADDAGAPVRLYHETCAHDLQAQVVCMHCREPVRRHEVQFCVGPGYSGRCPAAAPTSGTGWPTSRAPRVVAPHSHRRSS